ncbi:MAG: glutamine amidotransferase [Lysobacter sp.]|nr:glutamine amidotransferase [Lysobacter sp.]
MRAPFLILETGQPVASMRRHGTFSHWIRVAAGLEADDAVICRVADGEALPRRDGFAGVMVTGSAAMVTDRHDWSERSAAWLHEAAHADVPLFGICYGHQLLAHALGGEVGDNPAGREMGTIALALQPHAHDDPLFAGLPASMPAHAFRWRDRVWGVQFHPEFSTQHMRGYVHARQDALASEGRCALRLSREITAAPHARNVLRRFARHARTLRAS